MIHILLLTVSLLVYFQQEPDTAAQFNRAVALQQEGRFREAEQEYRALVKRKPDYLEALANLGAVIAQQGRYSEAIEYLSNRAQAFAANGAYSAQPGYCALSRQTVPGSHVSFRSTSRTETGYYAGATAIRTVARGIGSR